MSDAKHWDGGPRTLVEEGTQFKGSLTSKCPIEVKGRVEGDLTAPALTVSTTGAVHGKAKVGELHSQGELAGEFEADVVILSGTVKDNTIVRAKSLEVKLTSADSRMQVMFGECALEIGDMPVREESVTKAEKKEKKGKKAEAPEEIVASPAEPTMDRPPSVPPPKPERASIMPPNGAA
jgi:cytoskeletal protein CcmA (bactofilin family)